MARVQPKIGGKVQEAAVEATAKSSTVTAHLAAGPVEIEATFLDRQGKPLGGACDVTVRRNE